MHHIVFSLRATIITGALTLLASACGRADGSPPAADAPSMIESTAAPALSPDEIHVGAKGAVNDVLLVHGAFADGSSWSGVTERLQREGFTVQAVQLREQSLADDAALVRHAIGAIPRPVVVAGHSYGGFVISEASTGAPNVAGLVYVAAFAPEQGETIAGLAAGYPTAPAFTTLAVDDQGNATLAPAGFVQYFAADVSPPRARALAAAQHPTALTILGTPAGLPGWKTIPTFYQVSTNDQVIDPNLERFFAKRMGAYTVEIPSSHVSLISHPDAVAELIERAAGAR